MNLLTAISLTGAAACGILGAACLRAYRQARDQMERQLRPASDRAAPPLQRLESWFAGTGPGRACAAYLARCGLPLSPLKYALLLLAGSAVLYLFVTGFLGLQGLGAVSAVSIGLGVGTRSYLHQRRQQFLTALQRQLPEVAQTISNALRAGQSLSQAVSLLGRQARQPAQSVFRRCQEQVELGRPLDEALQELIARYDSSDLRLMLAAILLQRQTGGNLIAALEGISHTIRRREETLGEVRAALAQARQTVRVLPFLPFLCALMFNLALPGFLAPLFTAPGLIILAVVIGLQLAAAAVIRRMTRIEV